MTRYIILTVLMATFLLGARPAAAQQYKESDFIFLAQLVDFGAATKSAVKQFQAKKSLDADGIIGPQTWIALESATIASDATVFRSLVDLMATAGSIPVDEAGRLKVLFHWDQMVAKLLKKGSKGSEVKSLQQDLNMTASGRLTGE